MGWTNPVRCGPPGTRRLRGLVGRCRGCGTRLRPVPPHPRWRRCRRARGVRCSRARRSWSPASLHRRRGGARLTERSRFRGYTAAIRNAILNGWGRWSAARVRARSTAAAGHRCRCGGIVTGIHPPRTGRRGHRRRGRPSGGPRRGCLTAGRCRPVEHPVLDGSPAQQVVAGPAEQPVVAGAAEQPVSAPPATQPVRAEPAAQPVVAAAAQQRVVAAHPAKHVVTGGADQQVVACGAGDRAARWRRPLRDEHVVVAVAVAGHQRFAVSWKATVRPSPLTAE